MKLYMAVTPDKYELPMVIEENLEAFCKRLGISKEYCWNAMYRSEGGQRRGYRIVRIEVDSNEE